CNKADNEDTVIVADEMKIKQVFVNLIKNAIEAMREGYITLYVKELTNCVHIYIIDNGPGIPDEVLKQLGQSFYTTKETGTGLGLFISEQILNEHNGKLLVESKVGK